MPAASQVVLVSYDNNTQLLIQENNTIIETQTDTPNGAEIVIENVPTTGLITQRPEMILEVVSGDLYFANVAADLVTGTVKTNDFTVTTPGETDFQISATARRLLHVMINQIDYVDDCEITPVGSGRVRYTVPPDGYELEVGDRVYIHYTY